MDMRLTALTYSSAASIKTQHIEGAEQREFANEWPNVCQ